MKGLMILSSPRMGEVKMMVIKGETLFVAKDVCTLLGIEKYRDAMTRLDDDEKGRPVIVDTLGGRQEMATITESGLYHLILMSRKPEAKVFRRWITKDVIPSIRQLGYYIAPGTSLTGSQRKNLDKAMKSLLDRYVTDHDVVRCARSMGRGVEYVRDVISGREQNHGVMDYLQRRAIENKGQMERPYSEQRMLEVVRVLQK